MIKRMSRPPLQLLDEPVSVIFDHTNNVIAVASRAPDRSINVAQYSADDAGPVINKSSVRTTTFRWSAFTMPLDLQAVSVSDSDESITEALLAAIRTESDRLLPSGTDLANTALDWSRSAPGELTITKADLSAVETAVNYSLQWLRMGAESAMGGIDDENLPWTVSVETPCRALARFWLTQVADRSGDRYTAARGAVVAFLSVDNDGYAVALWSAGVGLVHEMEERLRTGIDASHIADRVAGLVNPASLSEFNIQSGKLTTIVLCAAHSPSELYSRIRNRLPDVELTPVENLSLGEGGDPLTYSTALAVGSILDDARIPSIDLAHNLQARLDSVEAERAALRQLVVEGELQKTVLLLLAPIVIMLGIALAWYAGLELETATIQADTRAATQEAARLANEARLRKSYEDQTRYYMGLTDQILQLRERQPFMLRLLTDLNDRWPRDATLSMASLRTNAAGSVELKGKTRQQDTVTQLASSLEFGGARFTDISPESKADIPGLSSGTSMPSGGALGTGPPPIISFSIKATYTPLAAALGVPKPPAQPPQGGAAK